MLLFVDGMGHYDTPWIDRKWTTVVTNIDTTWTVEPTGREVNCIQRVGTGGGALAPIGIAPLMTQTGPWTPTASGVFGGAFRVNSSAMCNTIGNPPFFRVESGGSHQITLVVNNNGTFTLWRNDASEVALANSAEGFLDDTWFEFEVKWLIHPTAGSVVVKVNRVVILSISGVGTQANMAPLANWNSVTLLGMNRRIDAPSADDLIWRMCDVYLADLAGSGDDIRDFINVNPIDYIVPDGVGAASGWTPLSGANWTNVDEVPPDSDTSYVSATAAGIRDSYAMQNIPGGTVVLGAQQLILARKEDPGAAALQPVFREGGVNFDGPIQGVPSEDYYYLIQPYDTNPATGNQFTAAEINADEFGQLKES